MAFNLGGALFGYPALSVVAQSADRPERRPARLRPPTRRYEWGWRFHVRARLSPADRLSFPMTASGGLVTVRISAEMSKPDAPELHGVAETEGSLWGEQQRDADLIER